MNHYRIALNFEDGVTRFVDCGANEKGLDAAFRNRINLPMDCSDGVCGTCKCRAETGSYDLGDDYIDEALTADEAAEGLVLTCQMIPTSDCVIAVPVPSTACKTSTAQIAAVVGEVTTFADAVYELVLDIPTEAPAICKHSFASLIPSGQMTREHFSGPIRRASSSISFCPGASASVAMMTLRTRSKSDSAASRKVNLL